MVTLTFSSFFFFLFSPALFFISTNTRTTSSQISRRRERGRGGEEKVFLIHIIKEASFSIERIERADVCVCVCVYTRTENVDGIWIQAKIKSWLRSFTRYILDTGVYIGDACKNASELSETSDFSWMKRNKKYLNDVPVGCDAGDGLCHVRAMRAEKHDERAASSRRRLGLCLATAAG